MFQRDLLESQQVWNTHSIRKSAITVLPCSKPILLYSTPELFGYEHYMCPVDHLDIDVCEADNKLEDDIRCDRDVYEISTILMEENDIQQPSDPYEATTLYIWLRTEIKHLL
ncbi:hypothetical protein FSP39_022497 [Pinctada imbricata]|uniref:Uncharacterized protein n=1 Tax=Pinctada imbricata TaxID=66713 RepID=A0AA89C569_PINIB|nr:hypothetical protein FSP39_022497 [Pinctada imbricata]